MTAILDAATGIHTGTRREVEVGAGADIAALASQALVVEATHTVKPGLVDGRNSGSHQDMDLDTFLTSAQALHPWWPRFVEAGARTVTRAPADLLEELRRLGLDAEGHMLEATGGVNTHKGAIFAMGLLCGAHGRLRVNGAVNGAVNGGVTVERLCGFVASMTGSLVRTELDGIERPATAGERLYVRHGLTGARGEAASGYVRAREVGLTAYRCALSDTGSPDRALAQALLSLLATNADTNLAHRGGVEAITSVRRRALHMLRNGGVRASSFDAAILAFDDDLIRRRLSPGGTADLLAVTWLFTQLTCA